MCDKDFTSKKDYIRHVGSVHTKLESQSYLCRCDYRNYRKGQLPPTL